MAKVNVINHNGFSSTVQYVAKFNGCFAHGETKEKAKQDAERKFYSSIDVDSKIKEFHAKFKKGREYSNKDFYDWHTILTGSCDSGKDMFLNQHGISLEGKMTPEEFISYTKNAYGSEIIKKLIK